ncbi:MAG: glycosyltransferase [Pseudomonadales bacterium]|nr:glycosyltransferase [Pseudomonadales bacterium]
MHILWINDHADFTGGCEQYIYQTVILLKAEGIESSLLYRCGAPVNPAFTSVFNGAFPLVEASQQIEKIAPDLLYIHRLENIDTLKAIVLMTIKKIRFYHDHKLFCLREHKYTTLGHHTCCRKVGAACYACLGFINKGNKGFKIHTLGDLKLEMSINRQLDYFVVGSDYMAEHLTLHNFPTDRILTAPLYTAPTVNVTRVDKAQKVKAIDVVNETGFLERKINKMRNGSVDHVRGDTQHLVFVGQLVRGKGLDTLLDAMGKLDDSVNLTVCGSGSMEHNYRDQTRKLGIEKRVEFVGQLNNSELSYWYERADIVVIPARAPETFCLVGIESLLHGKPVVTSNVGGMMDWFKPNYNGLSFTANKSKELAHAIRNILFNKGVYSSLVENIRSDNYDRFKPQHHLNLLTAMFSELLEAS